MLLGVEIVVEVGEWEMVVAAVTLCLYWFEQRDYCDVLVFQDRPMPVVKKLQMVEHCLRLSMQL